MQIAIKPVDVWLFRDGKPFVAGEDHLAESAFPPSPFTLQGAIRTKVLVDKGVSLSAFAKACNPDPDVGYGDNFGNLRLLGPLVMRRKGDSWERLIPMPADVVKVGSRYELLRPNSQLPFVATNLPNDLQLLWAQTDERVTEAKGWLPEEEWERYLQGQPPQQVVGNDELFVFEPRFGIAIDASKGISQEGMLYQMRFVRLCEETALWAEVNGVKMDGSGFLRFGGEGRAASYEVLQNPLPSLSQLNAARNATRFKVVLAAPAWFSGGWQPEGGDWSRLFGTSVQLISAAIPRQLHLGGFDVAKGIPKPLRTFVPAGAVYFFESKQPIALTDDFAFTETPDEVKEQNNGANAWAQIGLGAALIGAW